MNFLISLGSNLPEDKANEMLSKAETYLSDYFDGQISFSSHYSTPGVGSGIGKTYVNSVAKGETTHSYEEIRKTLKDYEIAMGRTPELKFRGIVPIDLDLLTLGDIIYKVKDLTQEYLTRGLSELS